MISAIKALLAALGIGLWLFGFGIHCAGEDGWGLMWVGFWCGIAGYVVQAWENRKNRPKGVGR